MLLGLVLYYVVIGDDWHLGRLGAGEIDSRSVEGFF